MRIKISAPGHYPSADLNQYLDQKARAEDSYHLNEPIASADAWFVFEETLPEDNLCKVPSNRVFFLGAETARPLGFYYQTPGWLAYLNQFERVYSPQELYWEKAHLDFPFLPWMINSNHGPDLFAKSARTLEFLRGYDHPEKSKTISVFCSSKEITAEHGSRLRFVSALKQHFGPRLDWFGNGVNPLDEKWQGLAPYKYSIVLENQSASHVLTEKIQDAFLALSMPIYWGAPEASALFPADSFAQIDIRDLRGSIERIEEILQSDPYESLIPALLKAKSVVTEDLNFLFRMRKILDDPTLDEQATPSPFTLHPLGHFASKPPRQQRTAVQQRLDTMAKKFTRPVGPRKT